MKPAYTRISPVNIDGLQTNRLMLVLRTKGCEYARETGGCTVCGFSNNAVENIKSEQILQQLDYVLENNGFHDVKEVDLLTLGSFYNDNEVKAKTRKALLNRLSALPNIKKISIESRAEYITPEKLNESRQFVDGKTIELGIGLESANDTIRNEVIKKGLTREDFERVLRDLKEANFSLLVYLLIKPPGLSENAAIQDAVNSVKYVYETADKIGVSFRIAFEPVFICKNTPLEKLFLNAEYRLVNLWSVVEVILKTHHYGNIFVGLSDEDLSLDRMPGSCSLCYHTIIREIENFNKTQDVSALKHLDCQCKTTYLLQRKRGDI